MNNKGQVPTILLFVMAIILGVTALYTMIKFNGNFDLKSEEFTDLAMNAEFNENYVKEQTKLIFAESVQKCGGCSSESLKEKIKSVAGGKENINLYSGVGNFYAKIRNNDFEVETDEGTKLKITGLFINSEIDYNKIQRNFDICLEVNDENILECK